MHCWSKSSRRPAVAVQEGVDGQEPLVEPRNRSEPGGLVCRPRDLRRPLRAKLLDSSGNSSGAIGAGRPARNRQRLRQPLRCGSGRLTARKLEAHHPMGHQDEFRTERPTEAPDAWFASESPADRERVDQAQRRQFFKPARRPRNRAHSLSYHPGLRLKLRHHAGHTAKFRRVAVERSFSKVLPACEVGDLLCIGHREPKVGGAQAVSGRFVQCPRNALDVVDLVFEIFVPAPAASALLSGCGLAAGL